MPVFIPYGLLISCYLFDKNLCMSRVCFLMVIIKDRFTYDSMVLIEIT